MNEAIPKTYYTQERPNATSSQHNQVVQLEAITSRGSVIGPVTFVQLSVES